MFYIIVSLFAFILIGVSVYLNNRITYYTAMDHNTRERTDHKLNTLPVAALFLVVWLVLTLLSSIHQVDARNVGVVKTFGSITGQVGEGFQFTMPWQTVEEWNVRTQVIEPDDICANGTKSCLNAGSVDIQDVYVSIALNMSVNPRDIQSLAREIGTSYRETIVLNRLAQVVKAVVSTYKAEEILANREKIRAQITERMRTEMDEYSISVDDVLLTNIDFTDQFRQSIEAKVVAEQNARTEENKVAISQAQAKQAEAQAQGRALALIAEASGQAEANRLVNASLTPQLIQFQAIQKFNDNVQIALIPSGTGNLLDPSTFLNR